MTSPNNPRFPPGRSLSASRSISQSIYAPTASSRPFLNMLNPLGRAYQGYTAANQSVLEEDEEDADGASPRHDDIDLEAQVAPTSNSKASIATSTPLQRLSGGSSTEPGVLRPNVREDDRVQEESESDGEVPQSFLIESPAARRNPLSRKGRSRDTRTSLNATTPRDPPRISVPPRPSEINPDRPPSRLVSVAAQPNPKRGLDAYERALWNWVNVYNLDAFLQEVYMYYHGKGIYSIALKRGLNLLCGAPFVCQRGLLIPSPAQSGSSSAFRHSSSAASIIRAYTPIKSHIYPTSSSSAVYPGEVAHFDCVGHTSHRSRPADFRASPSYFFSCSAPSTCGKSFSSS
jgi:autophagy-related protein 9